jgi:corrinoid protein of di/trimethylamine methyltransferase
MVGMLEITKGKEVIVSLDDLAQAVVEGDEENAKSLCNRLLRAGKVAPADILDKGLTRGLSIVGERMETGEFFLAEVILSAHVFKTALEILQPHLIKGQRVAKGGKVVIGTIYHDVHDIGKNLVGTMLQANGFEVVDLGVSVSPQRFVAAAKDTKADIIAMSALLTTTMLGMEDVIKELERTRYRQRVKVLVGGAPLTEEFARGIGADAYGRDAFQAVAKAQELLGVR